MRETHPLTARGVVYWQSLIAEPCPGCGMTGREGDGKRCGNVTQERGIDYILCVQCDHVATMLPDDHPAKVALGERISESLDRRK